MSHRPPNRSPELDALTLAALTWLASGLVLLLLTPLPARDAAYGWSTAFWLIAAPTALLIALHPRAVLAPAKTWQRARGRRGSRR